jgi:hypothetical protein
MDQETEVVVAKLPKGVEVLAGGGTANVSVPDNLDLQQLQGAVAGLAQVVGQARRRVRSQ